jgi:acetyl-CoA carboxylase biotin carboxyl carrier protein
MSLRHEDVLRILALLDASGFDELRLETSDYKLHVRRGGAAAAAGDSTVPSQAPERTEPADSAQTASPAATPARPAGNAAAAADTRAVRSTELIDVTAPLLGTFYASPQPGAPPFVTVGAAVDADTVIGIVEVMKLMNSVCAGVRGVVTEFVARDGALVEFGEVLLRIAPVAT